MLFDIIRIDGVYEVMDPIPMERIAEAVREEEAINDFINTTTNTNNTDNNTVNNVEIVGENTDRIADETEANVNVETNVNETNVNTDTNANINDDGNTNISGYESGNNDNIDLSNNSMEFDRTGSSDYATDASISYDMDGNGDTSVHTNESGNDVDTTNLMSTSTSYTTSSSSSSDNEYDDQGYRILRRKQPEGGLVMDEADIPENGIVDENIETSKPKQTEIIDLTGNMDPVESERSSPRTPVLSQGQTSQSDRSFVFEPPPGYVPSPVYTPGVFWPSPRPEQTNIPPNVEIISLLSDDSENETNETKGQNNKMSSDS